jgi:SAM-dependent methyltransferase
MTDDGWFGEEIAATYDEGAAGEPEASALRFQVDVLTALAGTGPALEFAIGTGRVALPLSARGVPVAGIELSRAMVARLRAKPGGDPAAIPVAIGDMTTTRAPGAGSFTLVYLVFNTLMNVTTQDGQVDCFRNAAAHLAPGGCFVVEIGVPGLRRLPHGERYVTFDRSDRHVGIDEYDVASQRMWSHHVRIRDDGQAQRSSTPFRYAWPAELDLMARLAGLRLRDRWADWTGAPFTGESRAHVSVWDRPDD